MNNNYNQLISEFSENFDSEVIKNYLNIKIFNLHVTFTI